MTEHDRVVAVEAERDLLAQQIRDLHADAVREYVGETVLAERDQLRAAVKAHMEAYMGGADIKPTLAALEAAAGLGQQG